MLLRLKSMGAALIIFASLFAAGMSGATDQPDPDLAEAQAQLDDAFAQGDPAAIRAMMTPDHVAVTPFNPTEADLDTQMANLAKADYAFTSLENQQTFQLADNVVLVTQEKLYDGTYDGRPLPSKVLVSAIWVEVDGNWLQRYYQETAVTAPSGN